VKEKIILGVTLLLIIALTVGTSTALAAKPQSNGSGKDVISISNGFPSGAHETLNIHGKNESFVCEEPADRGNVINIPEYGSANITYVSGRKVNIDQLVVFDSCSDTFDGDPAEVWLPYEPEGYYVFARALGKPAKGNPDDVDYEPRSIIIENDDLSPIAYSLTENVSSPDDVELLELVGLITSGGTYSVNSTDEAGINLVRFDSEPDGKGRGKTLAKDITDMFMWTGWVFHPDLDVNGDGYVNELDVIADNSTADINQDGIIDAAELAAWQLVHPDPDDVTGEGDVDSKDVIADTVAYDVDGNGEISFSEFEAWLADNEGDPEDPLWYHYDTPVWVFTIADLVYHNQVYINEGIKNLQIRFYPVSTTEFSK